jgi:hypothetical protein
MGYEPGSRSESVGVTKWVSIEAVGMTKLAEQIFPLA